MVRARTRASGGVAISLACIVLTGCKSEHDKPEIIVTSSGTSLTDESGSRTTFNVQLSARPEGDVTLPVTSSDPSEGTVSASLMTFTANDWSTPRTLTVTGVDDEDEDGDQTYHVTFGPSTSQDSAFGGLTRTSSELTNTDDETPGFRFGVPSGPTSEAGGAATITVRLRRMPTANVTVTLVSANTGEGTIPPTNLTFTSDNWNAPQTVTVTGADDDAADGPQTYALSITSVTSADARYAALTLPVSVSLVNVDDDGPWIVVTPGASAITSESSRTATFTVVLSAPPIADVMLALASNAPDEGIANRSSLVFTSANWNAPQTVTVTGLNDDIEDGDQAYAIVFRAPTSSDSGYAGLPAPASVELTNVDNDTPGFTFEIGDPNTTESGSTGFFSAVLNTQPTDTVTLTFASSDAGEGTTSPTTLVFTTSNWSAPQYVSLTGHDDDIADGDQPFSVVFAAPTSTDARYAALAAPQSLSFTNIDNETPGFLLTSTTNLTTTESAGSVTFTVALRSRPTADVTVTYASSKPLEGLASPSSLVFTTDNWNAAQTITVTGQNDDLADGSQPYTIDFAAPTSTDATYAGLAPFVGVSIMNRDNDSAGITVTAAPTLSTTEAGGPAMFTVVLDSEPTANVTLTYASSNPNEGRPNATSVVFLPNEWQTPKSITVLGWNDDVSDGNQPYSIVFAAPTSADATYSGLAAPASVGLTNTDDDSAGVTITATPSLTTTESGGLATFTVVLTSEPTANVIMTTTSTRPTEGTSSPAMLTFAPGTWNVPQTVTVTGQNDDVADGNQGYAIAFGEPISADVKYDALAAPMNVPVTNTDNDTPGITVTQGLSATTSESGHTATFTLVLTSRPSNDVTLGYASTAPLEGTVSPTSVTITPATWNVPRTVTVTGQNDAALDGNQPYDILFMAPTSMDAAYAALPAPTSVHLTNIDNDAAAPSIALGPVVQLAPSSQTTVSFGGYLNGESFQQDGILTYNGYQYSAYWDTVPQVIVARRPVGGVWETTPLDPEYVGISNDAHNVIVLGISPADGRLHIVFDHHTSNLHYNYSVAGLVSNPGNFTWQTARFQPTFTSLLGSTFISAVTYPRFITTPSGKLLLEFRNGTSGNGDEEMWEYDGATSTWSPVGVYISGFAQSINPYIHGIEYNGTRLHVAWCWRATPNATTNFGLAYAYSDDDGRTWMNNVGQQIGVANSVLMSVNSPGLHIWQIPQNRGYINQEHMTVDNAGRVHVLVSHMPDAQADDSNFTTARTKSQFFHYWRDTNGLWRRNATGIPVDTNFRGKLAVSSTNTLYAILPRLRIAAASASSNWTNWSVINTSYSGQYFSDPLIDRSQLRLGNTLTVFAPTINTGGVVSIDTLGFTLN